MIAVVAQDLTKAYGAGGSRHFAVRNLSFRLDQRIVSLVGPNGCGKSTVCNLLSGQLAPDAGRVLYEPPSATDPVIGFAFQNYRASLLPWLDAAENIAFPLRLRGVARAQRRRRADEVLSQFALPIRPSQWTYELSGGQQQLMCLLRAAVVAEPEVLILDEPSSALDQQSRWSATFLIERIWMQRPVPTLFVSHDVDEAIIIADEVWMMSRNGRIERRLPISQPRPRTVAGLISASHIACRKEIIEFLRGEGAVRDAFY